MLKPIGKNKNVTNNWVSLVFDRDATDDIAKEGDNIAIEWYLKEGNNYNLKFTTMNNIVYWYNKKSFSILVGKNNGFPSNKEEWVTKLQGIRSNLNSTQSIFNELLNNWKLKMYKPGVKPIVVNTTSVSQVSNNNNVLLKPIDKKSSPNKTGFSLVFDKEASKQIAKESDNIAIEWFLKEGNNYNLKFTTMKNIVFWENQKSFQSY